MVLRSGDAPYGSTLATITADIIAHIDGIYIREGQDPWGKILAHIDNSL